MAATTWMQDVEAAIVKTYKEDADLASLIIVTGKIEAGLVDPLASLMLAAPDFPYVSVVAMGYGPDLHRQTGCMTVDVEIRVLVADKGTPELEVKTRVQQILAQLLVTTDHERATDLFALSNSTATIQDIKLSGGGGLTAAGQPEGMSWFQVEGQFTFTVEVQIIRAA